MAPSSSPTSKLPAADAATTTGTRPPAQGLYVQRPSAAQHCRRASAARSLSPRDWPPRRRSASPRLCEVDLRWPNDLLIGDRKAGGILVESKTEAGAPSFAVVGIGINVHQRSSMPISPRRQRRWTWNLDASISRQALLISLLESLQHETWALQDAGVACRDSCACGGLSTWISDRRVEVHGPQACVGITAGLDEHGFLLVQHRQGNR